MMQIAKRNVWTLCKGYKRTRKVNAAVTAGLKTSEITEADLSVVIKFLHVMGEPS